MSTKGFPELKQLYTLLGAPNNVMLQRGEHFPHNYNAVTRSAFYTWLNKHFKLGFPEPVIEKDYEVLSKEQLTVWDAQHPAPKAGDPEFERTLLKWLTEDAEKQLRAAAATPDGLQKEIAPAVEVLIGRTFANAGQSEWQLTKKEDRDSYLVMHGLVRNETYSEELPVTWLYPKKWNGRAVLWLGDAGKASLYQADGALQAGVKRIVDSGALVVGADLLFQGDFVDGGPAPKQTRVVKNPREFAGYTFGYNHPLFAQRTHDVLTLVKFLREGKVGSHPNPASVAVAGFGAAGPVVAAARAVAGGAIERAAFDTGGFRFGKLLDFREPQFLPGGAKYLDLPGMIALGASAATWVAGEESAPLAAKAELFKEASGKETAAAEWLVR